MGVVGGHAERAGCNAQRALPLTEIMHFNFEYPFLGSAFRLLYTKFICNYLHLGDRP